MTKKSTIVGKGLFSTRLLLWNISFRAAINYIRTGNASAPSICRASFPVTLIASLAVVLLTFIQTYAACDGTPWCQGESLELAVTDGTGRSVTDGMVFSSPTSLNLDAAAQAAGFCATEIIIPFDGCAPGPIYYRGVHKINVAVDMATENWINGHYMLGSIFCLGPDGIVSWFNVT